MTHTLKAQVLIFLSIVKDSIYEEGKKNEKDLGLIYR